MKRVITEILLIVVCFLLQTTVFKSLAFGGIVPNICLMITSCFGFMRGKKEGIFVGFVCGLIIDIFFGGGILGLYAFIYMLMGYLNGMFHRIFYPEDIKLPIFFVGITDLCYGLISYIFLFLLRTRFDFVSYLRQIIFPEIVYTILFTLIFYRLILAINNALEAEERKSEAKFV